MSLGIPSDQVSLIFNPIVPSSETIPFNPCNLVFLGRFNESHKRVNDILNAATQLQGSWSLHLLGDGPDRNTYKNMVEELGLSDHVEIGRASCRERGCQYV